MPKKMKNIEIILFLSLENGILGRVKFNKNPKKKKIEKEKTQDNKEIIEQKDILEKPKIIESEQMGFNLEVSKKIDEAIKNKIKQSNIKIKHETIEIREESNKKPIYPDFKTDIKNINEKNIFEISTPTKQDHIQEFIDQSHVNFFFHKDKKQKTLTEKVPKIKIAKNRKENNDKKNGITKAKSELEKRKEEIEQKKEEIKRIEREAKEKEEELKRKEIEKEKKLKKLQKEKKKQEKLRKIKERELEIKRKKEEKLKKKQDLLEAKRQKKLELKKKREKQAEEKLREKKQKELEKKKKEQEKIKQKVLLKQKKLEEKKKQDKKEIDTKKQIKDKKEEKEHKTFFKTKNKEKINLEIKAKEDIPKPEQQSLDEEVGQALEIIDELLGQLPDEKIDEFVQSDDFKIYEKVVEKYKKKWVFMGLLEQAQKRKKKIEQGKNTEIKVEERQTKEKIQNKE